MRRYRVKIVYLLPFSPGLNPIEEFFGELKRLIKRNWDYYEKDPQRGFDVLPEGGINAVSAKGESEGPFSPRLAGSFLGSKRHFDNGSLVAKG